MKSPRTTVSDIWQALEGKDVKDLLLNVGSGGGAAAAPAAGGAGGAAAGGDAAAPEEEKEEGASFHTTYQQRTFTNSAQRRRSQTRTWASVSSTKRLLSYLLRLLPYSGCTKRIKRHTPIAGTERSRPFSDTACIPAILENIVTAS
jgi:hypothetical protein